MKKAFFTLICLAILTSISCQRKEAIETKELFVISKNGKFGYIDKTGKVVIKPKFEEAKPFYEELAYVRIGGWKAYIDKKENVVFELQPNITHGHNAFFEGMAGVYINHKWGFIDKNGKIVIEPKFDEALGFSDGLAAVKIEDKWGYFDKTGKVVIKPKFDEALGFSDGLAAVKIEDKWGYIDKTGKVVIKPQFNIKSKFLIRHGVAVFESISLKFSEGLACIAIGDKCGYIDKTGKITIKTIYDWASDFYRGLSLVRIEDKYAYINKMGEYIWKSEEDWRFY